MNYHAATECGGKENPFTPQSDLEKFMFYVFDHRGCRSRRFKKKSLIYNEKASIQDFHKGLYIL